MSSLFLLIVVIFSPNGSRSLSMEKFETEYECFRAMQVVSREVPNVTASCSAIKRGDE